MFACINCNKLYYILCACEGVGGEEEDENENSNKLVQGNVCFKYDE